MSDIRGKVFLDFEKVKKKLKKKILQSFSFFTGTNLGLKKTALNVFGKPQKKNKSQNHLHDNIYEWKAKGETCSLGSFLTCQCSYISREN